MPIASTFAGYATQYGYGFDGDQVILEEQNNAVTATYTWGNGLIRRNGEYPLTDGRGNVRHMTDGSGTYTESVVLDPFGVTSASSGSSPNPYVSNASSGYRSDGDGPAGGAALQQVGARYYDAQFGVFLTRDTVLSQKSYQYCDGDPVNCTDPSGHVITNPLPNIFNDGFMDISGSAGTDGIGDGTTLGDGTSGDGSASGDQGYTGVDADPSAGTASASQGGDTVALGGVGSGSEAGSPPGTFTGTVTSSVTLGNTTVTYGGVYTYGQGLSPVGGVSYALGGGVSVGYNSQGGAFLQITRGL